MAENTYGFVTGSQTLDVSFAVSTAILNRRQNFFFLLAFIGFMFHLRGWERGEKRASGRVK
jgi:hypothetical protein